MLLDQYAERIISSIKSIQEKQRTKILQAADAVKNTLKRDGLIYIFGCGHSHILAEEAFYRAGGLANVAPILYEPLMLHEGAAESSRLEKLSGLATRILEPYPVSEKDLFFCLSTSGINGVPVEVTEMVRSRGTYTIAICSSAYFQDPARSCSGKHLYEIADLWLDNLAPHGDAVLKLEGMSVPMSPLSTITGAYLLNAILAEGTQLVLKDGNTVPVYLSGNISGGAEFNQRLIHQYQPRIQHL